MTPDPVTDEPKRPRWTRLTTWMFITYGIGIAAYVLSLCVPLIMYFNSHVSGLTHTIDCIKWLLKYGIVFETEYGSTANLLLVAGTLWIISSPCFLFLRMRPDWNVPQARLFVLLLSAIGLFFGIAVPATYYQFAENRSPYVAWLQLGPGMSFYVSAFSLISTSAILAVIDLGRASKLQPNSEPPTPE